MQFYTTLQYVIELYYIKISEYNPKWDITLFDFNETEFLSSLNLIHIRQKSKQNLQRPLSRRDMLLCTLGKYSNIVLCRDYVNK